MSYYLPAGYQAQQTHDILVLRRPDGSVAITLSGQQAIGEILERCAWEDDTAEWKGGRVERAYEWFLELPAPVVLGLLWLVGMVLVGMCVVALYSLWLVLLVVLGG